MIEDAPEGYSLSDREELGPLVRDFHELVDRDLTNGELLALDFALEWVFFEAEAQFEDKLLDITAQMDIEYGVTYGSIPNIKLIPGLYSLGVAKRIASALNGQVRMRRFTGWEWYKE